MSAGIVNPNCLSAQLNRSRASITSLLSISGIAALASARQSRQVAYYDVRDFHLLKAPSRLSHVEWS